MFPISNIILQKSGIKNISITNRTNEKCLFLKKKFNYLKFYLGKLQSEIGNYDIIINATSLRFKKWTRF